MTFVVRFIRYRVVEPPTPGRHKEGAGRAYARGPGRFRPRLFPERRYRLPVKWVLLAVMAGLAVLMFVILRRLPF